MQSVVVRLRGITAKKVTIGVIIMAWMLMAMESVIGHISTSARAERIIIH